MSRKFYKFIMVLSIVFTSCAKEQCICTIGDEEHITTEDDIAEGASLLETCNSLDAAAKKGASSDGCSL